VTPQEKFLEAWNRKKSQRPTGPAPEIPIHEWTPKQPSRGFGDTIAKITSAVGIKPCGGCKRRQEALNRRFPYGK
jgi:hypothetical protein